MGIMYNDVWVCVSEAYFKCEEDATYHCIYGRPIGDSIPRLVFWRTYILKPTVITQGVLNGTV